MAYHDNIQFNFLLLFKNLKKKINLLQLTCNFILLCMESWEGC